MSEEGGRWGEYDKWKATRQSRLESCSTTDCNHDQDPVTTEAELWATSRSTEKPEWGLEKYRFECLHNRHKIAINIIFFLIITHTIGVIIIQSNVTVMTNIRVLRQGMHKPYAWFNQGINPGLALSTASQMALNTSTQYCLNSNCHRPHKHNQSHGLKP